MPTLPPSNAAPTAARPTSAPPLPQVPELPDSFLFDAQMQAALDSEVTHGPVPPNKFCTYFRRKLVGWHMRADALGLTRLAPALARCR